MKISDEMLMAYADDQLDPGERAEVEQAIAADPALAKIVERHRALAGRVQAAYRGVLDEPVPARLATLTQPSVTPQVVDFVARRDERRVARAEARPMRWQLPQWSAMAAAVTLGLFVGVFALRGPGSPWEETPGGLVARGELERALTVQLAGSTGTGAPGKVQTGVSFREKGGAYCRTFQMQQEAPVAGLACRAGEDWQLRVLAAAQPAEGELRTAASMPIAVLQAVDAAIDGEPLDAAAETAARDAGWR